MTRGFQKFTKRYANVIGVLIGLAVVSSILFSSGCMPSSLRNPTTNPDRSAPTSAITFPTAGATVLTGVTVNITGTASDTGGGSVARVDVSVDGGATFSAATGTTSWSFSWTPTTPGQATIISRAVDNSGNVQNPTTQITVTVIRDTTPPTSIITSPKAGEVISTTTTVSITGNASDAGGGTVARVEVSVDGGATWNLATGTTAWSFNWTPATPGPATIRSRAVDDSGNQQNPPAEVTVTVPIRVPLDQPTIKSAINVASDGDTALVAPGTYVENINFRGKTITVRSESGRPEDTIIDGGNTDPVVSFISGEGRGSSLNGFTLQNGRGGIDNHGFANGGGILIRESSPTITNNVITNNHACLGAGIGILSGSPLVQGNTITANISACGSNSSGGGIRIIFDGSPEILDNVISDNETFAGGGIWLGGGRTTPIIKRNVIKENRSFVGGRHLDV